MHKIACIVVLATLGAVGFAGCKKKSEEAAAVPAPTAKDAAPVLAMSDAAPAEATPPPAPTAVEDAADEYKVIAEQILADLSNKDFASFSKNSMVSKEQLKAMMEDGWKACPEMAPTEEQRPEAEQMLADYDPAGEAVKSSFEDCLGKHKFSKATYVSATSREHVTMCGAEMADHVELQLTIGKTQAMVVLDDLVKTREGWRLVDGGISCADQE